MLRERISGVLSVLLMGVCVCSPSAAFADAAVSNETMFNEIQQLRRTVESQQRKIDSLEQRLIRQENSPQSAGQQISASEIDKRIDERISSVPAYQAMDGLSLSVGTTTVVQGVRNANGAALLSQKEDVTDASVSADITFNKKFDDYGEGVVYITAGQGAGVEDELQLFSNVNNDADNDQNVRLAEAWYEYYIKPVSGALTFGKLDATKYIDTNAYANDETTQYLGRMFRNSAVVEFPANAAGFRVSVAPIELLDIEMVAVDADADWEDVFDNMFVSGQVNIKPKFFDRGGSYRFYGWRNGANHTKWADGAKDKEISYGYGISFDQELTDIIGVFARYGWQDPKVFTNGSAFSLERSWSIGPQFKGSLWGRADDVTGIGFGQIMASRKYRNANAVLAKTESHLEWYYNYKVNDHLSLSPDLQIIWRPYGKDAANGDGTIVVGGLRGQMDF